MSTYLQTAIEDALGLEAPVATGLDLGDGSPLLRQAVDHCWERLEALRARPDAPGSAARTNADRIRAETTLAMERNPYAGITKRELEAVIRAAYTSHQPPEVLLAVWAKEGSTRSVDAPERIAWASSEANARTIFRSIVFFDHLGIDHFIDVTAVAGADNRWDSSDAAAPRHETHFSGRVRALVSARLLPQDITSAINAELRVTRPTSGSGFAVAPTTRFYALVLLLVDALFTQHLRAAQSEFPGATAAIAYLRWNMRASSWRDFIASADRHRREPQFRQPMTSERWALHTRPRENEFGQPRRNAIRFGHYIEAYRPIFAGAMNLITPGIEDLRRGPREASVSALAGDGPIEAYRSDPTGTSCARGPQPGAQALVRELQGRFGGRGEIYNCRPVRGGSRLSLHGEGRAVDWYRHANVPEEAAEAQRILDWLLAADAEGNQHALARRMGVQELIWNRRIWSARRHAEGWRPYGGPNPHTDHIHIGLTWPGARMETSHWRAAASAPARAQQQVPPGPPPSSSLRWPGATDEQLRFMRRVYDTHVTRSARRRAFVANVPDAELGAIEAGARARTVPAERCRALLAAARAALPATVERVSIASAYRSVSQQFASWQRNFPRYYEQTRAERERAPGGAHGEQAVEIAARHIGGILGAPGYSLHNDGRAIDFGTRENGLDLGASTAQRAAWRGSWLFGWLSANGPRFGFHQNTSIDEPWHWEHRADAPPVAVQALQAIPAGQHEVPLVGLLREHHDVGPDMVLRWNAMTALPPAIDVVVHLHGFSTDRHLNLLDRKLPLSGLDFAPPTAPRGTGAPAHPAWTGRTRPTLLVIPRGRARPGHGSAYEFPALTGPGAFADLIEVALGQLWDRFSRAPRQLAPARIIIAAHSGGGAALGRILARTAGTRVDPHEVHVFDALYGDPASVLGWVERRLGEDIARLRAGVPDPGAYMATDGGGLRVLWTHGTPRASTKPSSDKVAEALRRRIPASVPHAGLLQRHYRVEQSRIGHSLIPYWYGGRLLHDVTATVPPPP